MGLRVDGEGMFAFMVGAMVVGLVVFSGDIGNDLFVGGMAFCPLGRYGAR